MIKVQWTLNATKDLTYWKNYNVKKYERVKILISSIQETSFLGIGKPEPLKHLLSGLWSRRINHKHRLIYSIIDKQIIIYNCRFHYEKD